MDAKIHSSFDLDYQREYIRNTELFGKETCQVVREDPMLFFVVQKETKPNTSAKKP